VPRAVEQVRVDAERDARVRMAELRRDEDDVGTLAIGKLANECRRS
jgi:hypothetical protein